MPMCFGGRSSSRSRKDIDYSYSTYKRSSFGDRFVEREYQLPVEHGYGWSLTEEELAAQSVQRVYHDGTQNNRDYGYLGVVVRKTPPQDTQQTQKSQTQGANSNDSVMLVARKWEAYDKRCACDESRNEYYVDSVAAKVHYVQETESDPRIKTFGAKKTARVVQRRPGISVTSHTVVAEVYKPQRGINYSGNVLKVHQQGYAPSMSPKSSSKLEPERRQDTSSTSSFGSYAQLQPNMRQQYTQYTTTESKKDYDKRMKKMGLHRR